MAAKSTKDELRELFLEMEIATKSDIREIVEDVFHEQITEYHNDMVMPEINKLKDKNDIIISALKKLKETVDELKARISFIKSEIRNLKSDLAVTVTRKEFEKFKSQILRN